MAYIDVVTLAEAKAFLRVDDGFTTDDALITILINYSGEYVERYTDHLLFARNKDYVVFEGERRVYDYPVNSVVSPADSGDYEATEFETWTLYELSEDTLTLNVGYAAPSDVPAGLKIEMLNLINNLYHGNDGSANDEDIQNRLFKYKRHII